MRTIKFQATLLSGHKQGAVEVPFDPGVRWVIAPQKLWPGRRGFPVTATLNGVAFASAIVSRARRFWLVVPASVAQSAGTTIGDLATVTVAPDTMVQK